MFNKKKKLQKSFNYINKYIDGLELSDQEKSSLNGLLSNVKKRMEATA